MKNKNLLLLPALISFLSYTANAQTLNADFSFTRPTPCSTSIQFTDLSTGGTPPYQYLWKFGDGHISTIANPYNGYIVIGSHQVTLRVTDSNQNVDSTVQYVGNTSGGVFVGSVYCYGGCNGSMGYSYFGNPPVTFLWNTGDTVYQLYNLCAGQYICTTTDNFGNVCVDTTILSQPTQLTVSQTVANGTCLGNNGNIIITVSGGTAPYTYQWSNGSTTPHQTGLASGTYSATISDSRGCYITTTATINGNTLPLSFSTASTTCGAADGTVVVHPVGGSGVYSFQWSPVSGTDSILTGLASGTYFVTVTDTNGCVGADSVIVTDSCGVISGHVFNDLNGNGIKEAGESGIAGITIFSNGAAAAVTNQNGDYFFGVATFDTFIVQVFPISRYYCSGTLFSPDSITAPPGSLYTIIITQALPSSTGNNFGITAPQNPCGTISGYVFNDLNGSGTDDGEPRKSGVTVKLSNGQYAITDFNGMYSVEVPLNVAVTVSIASAPGSYFCGANQPYYEQTFPPFNGTYTVTLTSGTPTSMGNDFGVQQTSASYDVGIYSIRSFSAVSKGTFTAWMDFKSNGTTTDSCRLRVSFDPLIDFISASIQPTIVTGTYIEWVFPPGTTPSFYCMEMEFFLDPNVSAGTQLVWTGTYLCGSPDGCPGNDSLTVIQTVILDHPRQAYDNGFNFMEVEHTGTATGSLTAADSVFSYVINFQNTGTDTVYHLTIVDTLSPNLNIQTISTPFSSDAYKLHIPASNILIWEFNNILLPDSATDFQHSYGFVQYNIHMKPNLNPGTRIEHRGAISFNYDEPYFTNETSLIIKEPDDTTGIENLSNDAVKIYPNPGTGVFKIVLPENIGNDSKVKIYDVLGAMVLEKVLAENSGVVDLNLGEQADGLYFVRIETGENSWRGKVMLMR